MGKTIAEKILSEHSKLDLYADDVAVCKVDFCFGQDGTSSLIIDAFDRLGAKNVFDRNRFCMVIDHNSPSPNIGISGVHKRMREFAKRFGLKVFDVGCGVCHQIIPEEGLVVPGDLVTGADSHTCTYGALNSFSTGMGSTDLAVILATGKNWFKVPKTVKIILKNRPKKGVFSKDVILYIIGDMGADSCTYKAVEFTGEYIRGLDMDGRFTITNMAIELGAKAGLMEPDYKLFYWLKKYSKTKRRPMPHFADRDATYSEIIEYEVSKIGPQIARPHSVENVVPIEEALGTEVDVAYLGTCTNGRLDDLKVAARILKNRKIRDKVRFIVAPASRNILLEAIKLGIMDILISAGASVVTPGCGPCVGTHNGIPADEERVISSANRNFKGRMGNPKAFIYLGSSATVAASALTGKITDPRRYL